LQVSLLRPSTFSTIFDEQKRHQQHKTEQEAGAEAEDLLDVQAEGNVGSKSVSLIYGRVLETAARMHLKLFILFQAIRH